jgi:predicted Zn finger-like uncharacterized protein
MITRCPTCQTHFRVHADQLAARAGQVRCGKCSRVFDALERLIEEIGPVRPPQARIEPENPPAEAPEAAGTPGPAAAHAQEIDREAPDPAIAEIADFAVEAQEPEAPQVAIAQTKLAEPEQAYADAQSGESAGDLAFGPAEKAESAKPVHRWLWSTGALLLLLLLLAQAAYQYRSAIVLLVPESKPYATALCATLGCDLPMPRRIELMSIDASDLQADTTNPSVMVLTATLKNRAIFNQQHPSLELTLTDAQDQPVVRRVLAPADYLGKAGNAQAGFGANAEVAIKVFIEGSQVKATGYRLYLFYP